MEHFETRAVRTQAGRSGHREHSVPLYLTSSFVFDSAEQGRALFADEVEGNIYSRFSNPNTSEFIDKMAALEAAGVRLILCRTCLEYFGLLEKARAGIVGGMTDILEGQLRADKVIAL